MLLKTNQTALAKLCEQVTKTGFPPEALVNLETSELKLAKDYVDQVTEAGRWMRGDLKVESLRRKNKELAESGQQEFDLRLDEEAKVADLFDFDNRIEGLSFQHHAVCVEHKLTQEQSMEALKECQENGWTHSQLRGVLFERSNQANPDEENPEVPGEGPFREFAPVWNRIARRDPESLSEAEKAVAKASLKPVVEYFEAL